MRWPGQMLRELLDALLKKPATVLYPYDKSGAIAGFRGKLKFYPERCIGCQLCVRDCPAKAIVIKKLGDKRFEMDLDLGKCIYCGQCCDSCPKQALEMTGDFELAQLDRDKLKIVVKNEEPKNEEEEKKNV